MSLIRWLEHKLRLPETGIWGRKSLAVYSITSYLLGAAFGMAFMLAINSELFCSFGFFIVSLSIFHFTEFLFNSVFHQNDISFDSFFIKS